MVTDEWAKKKHVKQQTRAEMQPYGQLEVYDQFVVLKKNLTWTVM